MNVQTISLQQVPSQQFSINLDNQPCTIKVHQRDGHVYVDLYVNDEAIVLGTLVRDRVGITRHAYLPFKGELVFVDTYKQLSPSHNGMGSRWLMAYFSCTV